MNRKYLNIALAFVGVITILFVVVIVTKKKPTPVTPNKEQTVNQLVNDYSAIRNNFSKADLQIMFDSWAANGYPGEFVDFIKG